MTKRRYEKAVKLVNGAISKGLSHDAIYTTLKMVFGYTQEEVEEIEYDFNNDCIGWEA